MKLQKADHNKYFNQMKIWWHRVGPKVRHGLSYLYGGFESASSFKIFGSPLKRWLSPKLILRSIKKNIMMSYSSLIGRVILINLLGLLLLVGGIMFLTRFQAGLIESKVNSLLVQGEIIARAVATSAAINLNNELTIDPEYYLERKADNLRDFELGTFEFAISPPKAAQILTQLVKPTGVQARIYDRELELLIDSNAVYLRSSLGGGKKPPPKAKERDWIPQSIAWLFSWFPSNQPPKYVDIGKGNGTFYDEVRLALAHAEKGWRARSNEAGELVLSAAIPIKHEDATLGVLFLNTPGGEIDKIVDSERMAILRVLLFVLGVSLVVSAFMAYQIAHPIVRLSNAANVVSRSVRDRKELPDFTHRSDEIGILSASLRTMTDALFNRLESIERFAADVAHELKNPLTSMRSAFEVLPYIKDEEAKEELRETIRHDLDRMNRLITDISDASRADAEMAMEEREVLDVIPFLTRVTETLHALYHDEREVDVYFEPDPELTKRNLKIKGHEGRLGQVMTNLIENAVSFSLKDGKVLVKIVMADKESIRIMVEDEGPGIPPEFIEKIFKRFYTDRPEGQGFGNNSGLGLNISEQIVEAHHGLIWAENIVDSEIEAERKGARFNVVLPLYFDTKRKK